jgi:hypothetical protein
MIFNSKIVMEVKQMERYEEAKLEIVAFEAEDVITTSCDPEDTF